MPSVRLRTFLPTWMTVLGFVCILGTSQTATAQPPVFGQPTPPPAAPSIDTPAAREQRAERERLYAELASEVDALERMGNLVKRVAALVRPNVVHIEAHKTEEQRGRRESFEEAGSGVIVEIDGSLWVLTNRHVIKGADAQGISLRLSNGREIKAQRVVSDAYTDIAVIAIEDANVSAAKLGDSSKVEIGDFVLAIGSPFGLSHSVTFGILSAKGRRDLSLGEEKIELQDFFQTDAAINPGNSGGPLLNLRGEIIALNTAIASSSGGSEGIGFAIPVNMAMRVANQLVRFGKLKRAYLGVTLDPNYTAADAEAKGIEFPGGALVKEIRPGSPAEQAKLRKGDVIVMFGPDTVENDDHLVARVGLTPVGTQIPLVIVRDGQRYQTSVSLMAIPE
ncbi:Putative serine protease HtrA [Roseimaritima multifibrata]|uniref:Serine protease HtrA n=1 Tax=Roseimaritima multifibrata TaxID=1930274 RepID=A0A517MFS1_9BACT|nr:trypsin-like peptidase domain-containing protein [Roseimaritima multifibrata]QDS93730.1 Putative serine protease HtrA [Roseimaritima multifibrata]